MRQLFTLVLLVILAGCGKKVQAPESALTERDRDLYVNSMKSLDKSRFTAARLQLQTLMATYPDSEYAPQAKYGYAESFYRESGSSNLASAEIEFKDFITFFPTNDLADDAQLMVAMTHVRQIQKPDRDDTQARLAEYELTALIEKYPDSPLLDEAKEKLRNVQEILAASLFGPAKQYFLRRAYPATIDRCDEIMKKYPDYSAMDKVLYLMAESYRRMDGAELSISRYEQIVRDYPLSASVGDATQRLIELNAAVPSPNPIALERARQKQPDEKGLLSWLGLGLFRGPGVSTDTNAASVRDKGSELSVDQGKP